MNEEAPKVVTVPFTAFRFIDLPDTPHALFARGELADAVSAPEGARVEVIGEEVVMSPAPDFRHSSILGELVRAFGRAGDRIPDFPWEARFDIQINFVSQEHGYEPDLIVAAADVLEGAWKTAPQCLGADEVEMVVEVTSPRNFWRDRPPMREETTKWTGYARAEIPYYLLIDRHPEAAHAVLYTIPDAAAGAYLDKQTWSFGEAIVLPDPFGLKIPTDKWCPWK